MPEPTIIFGTGGGAANQPNAPSPIGFVTVNLLDWAAGQSQTRISWPQEARPGALG